MSNVLNRKQIAWRIAHEIKDGSYVNLGIGMPEMVANYIPEEREIVFHSENGLLGMGPSPIATSMKANVEARQDPSRAFGPP